MENKLVPRLRFPEFENVDSWEERKINDFFNVGSSKRVLQDDWTRFGVPFYRTRELVSLNKNEAFRSEIFISEKLFNEIAKKYGLPNEGDFLVSGVGTLGIYYQVKKNDKFYFKDGNVIWFKKKKAINSDYFRYCFQSDFIQTQIIAQSSASTVGTYTIQNASITKFHIPKSTLEQQKIADCLCSLDDLIRVEAEKLAALKDHKKGLIQQLFPVEGEKVPKLRFPEFKDCEEWEYKKLGDCLLRHPEYGLNAAAVPYSDNLPTYLRITDISEDGFFVSQQKVSVDWDVTEENYLDDGDIVLARTGASVGKSYMYRNYDGKLVFAGFLIRIKPNKNRLVSELLYQFLSTEIYWKWVDLTSQRSGQPGINGNEYASLSVPLPPTINEQQKIADCLSSLDEQMNVQKQKIEDLKLHKKGLMQGLFPKY